VSDVLVYAATARASTARALLSAACQATGMAARLELYGTGSLYQRLGPRHAPPLPDIVLWSGPCAAQAAAVDGLLQPYQPPRVVDGTPHEASWRWTTLDYAAVGTVGAPAASSADLLASPSLAFADPERSESGLGILLAMLDRARQVDGDVELPWTWWQQRARQGLLLVEDDAEVPSVVADARASLGLTLVDSNTPLVGLPLMPQALGLAASSANADAARRLLDWMTGSEAASVLRLSPWQAQRNGLQTLLSAAPMLDVDWASRHYTAVRQRWASSGFAPDRRT
jgi:ABC-type Fe3+ transport system substrate-binding protein